MLPILFVAWTLMKISINQCHRIALSSIQKIELSLHWDKLTAGPGHDQTVVSEHEQPFKQTQVSMITINSRRPRSIPCACTRRDHSVTAAGPAPQLARAPGADDVVMLGFKFAHSYWAAPARALRPTVTYMIRFPAC
jgi:hypothetical protein